MLDVEKGIAEYSIGGLRPPSFGNCCRCGDPCWTRVRATVIHLCCSRVPIGVACEACAIGKTLRNRPSWKKR